MTKFALVLLGSGPVVTAWLAISIRSVALLPIIAWQVWLVAYTAMDEARRAALTEAGAE